LTAPSLQAGTPNDLAPELLDGAAADARSGIYSAGVLIYQTVTGRSPRGDFERLAGPLDAIVRRVLSRHPARRHQSAAELRDALLKMVPPNRGQSCRASTAS
jgi:serine/threonine protein kinase